MSLQAALTLSEAVDVATEMKQFAKKQHGSSYAIDRRVD
jgi:hypothetical protein